MSRVDYIYDEDTRLELSYGLLSASPNGVQCLLDLDVIRRSGTSVNWEDSLRIADDLHELAGSAFEAVVTDKARELFDAG